MTESAAHDAYQHQLAESPRTAELFERARERGYIVIVDTPPGLGPVVHRVLACSQHVLIPLQCEPLALQTTTQILRGIRRRSARIRGSRSTGSCSRWSRPGTRRRSASPQYVREQLPAGLVLDVVDPANASVGRGVRGGPAGRASLAEDPAAKAYRALAHWPEDSSDRFVVTHHVRHNRMRLTKGLTTHRRWS